MTARQLIHALYDVVGSVRDNNRDLLGEQTFTLSEVNEELTAAWAFEYLIAYIERNEESVDICLGSDEADPYGATISEIKNWISWGLARDGSMSDGERENLVTIEELVRRLDNA
jgi:hypothetical protein